MELKDLRSVILKNSNASGLSALEMTYYESITNTHTLRFSIVVLHVQYDKISLLLCVSLSFGSFNYNTHTPQLHVKGCVAQWGSQPLKFRDKIEKRGIPTRYCGIIIVFCMRCKYMFTSTKRVILGVQTADQRVPGNLYENICIERLPFTVNG